MGDTCEECGRSMRIDEHTIKAGRYCCKGCEEKAWRRNHTFTCKICGKEFVADTGVFGPKAHGYCSEECQRNGLLKQIKPKAEKMLKTLKKDVEKRQARIDKLVSAMRSEDPEVIMKAIKGSLFKRAGGCLVMCLKLIGLLIIFGIGYLVGENEESQMPRMSRANNAAGESAGATVESVVTTNANSAAIDMQKQKSEEQLLERRRELLQPAREDGNTSAPVAEQE